jgi:outer membrane PBP1 activator LpoA protein
MNYPYLLNVLARVARFAPPASRKILFAGLFAVLAGCQAAPPERPDWEPAPSADDRSIARLLAAAQSAAARPTGDDQASPLYLQLGWAYFDNADSASAADALARADFAALTPTGQNSYRLLQAQIAIESGNLAKAEQILGALGFTTPATKAAGARLCAARGDFVCAANRQIAAALANPEQNNLIWGYLQRTPGFSASGQAENQSGIAQGWWQLRLLELTSSTPRFQQASAASWRARWPTHPAQTVLQTVLQQSFPRIPTHIGLVLPLTGPLAGAGRAVRDGFAVAYLDGRVEPAFRLTFYDSQATPLPQIYERVLADGVDLIVGPLTKERVASLNALNPDVPVLALNYLDSATSAAANLLQLGLAIEDESVTIAQHVASLGINRLLVFHNYEDWSIRARQELADRWHGNLTIQPFTDVRTITESVGKAMDVAASQERHSALGDLFGAELEFLPRARRDVDAVVALVNNVEANALVPALRFHFARNLPVFACSQVVRGARKDQLTALENFQVSELPWYLHEDPLYQTMNSTFALAGNRFSPLYALGVDAFRLSLRLGHPGITSGFAMIGSTGALLLAENGRFQRDLTWGVVHRGELEPLPAFAHPPVTGVNHD